MERIGSRVALPGAAAVSPSVPLGSIAADRPTAFRSFISFRVSADEINYTHGDFGVSLKPLWHVDLLF